MRSKHYWSVLGLALILILGGLVGPAQAQEGYVGEIRMFAGNYAPQGWLLCNGQVLNIADYQVLFAVIWNSFGGNGQTNFALPDLRGRFPIGAGTGTGLTTRYLGEKGGSETATFPDDKNGVIPADDSHVGTDAKAVAIIPPYQAVNFIICYDGLFPPRP